MVTGLPKLRPPLVERANPMPLQPIQATYTYRPSMACSASAFWPGQPPLISVIGSACSRVPPSMGELTAAAQAARPAVTTAPARAAPTRRTDNRAPWAGAGIAASLHLRRPQATDADVARA